jgi:hypothetical protein
MGLVILTRPDFVFLFSEQMAKEEMKIYGDAVTSVNTFLIQNPEESQSHAYRQHQKQNAVEGVANSPNRYQKRRGLR